MEQIKELLNVLEKTPEMALWGLGIYFLFILIKAAFWIGAFVLLLKLFIKRLFDHLENTAELRQKDHLLSLLDEEMIGKSDRLFSLLNALKSPSGYVHDSDIREAIKIINEHKND